jgi:hypothetical protein
MLAPDNVYRPSHIREPYVWISINLHKPIGATGKLLAKDF